MLQRFCGFRLTHKRCYSAVSALCQQKTSKSTDGFKDEQVSSVQERTLFEQIFTQIMKKDEDKKKSKELLQPFISRAQEKRQSDYEDSNVQIVFEKKAISADSKVVQFLKDTNLEVDADAGGRAMLTTDDIRKYPVSLTSTYFAESNAEDTGKATSSYLDEVLSNDLMKKSGALDREINPETLNKIEAKHRLNAKLEGILQPHTAYLKTRIQTDSDCIQVIQHYLEQYSRRNLALEIQNTNAFQDIEKAALDDPKKLPQPYYITLPFIIRHLLTSQDFEFPPDRKYTLTSLVYNSCKCSPDISLYLNVCNVDFYNLLIEYSWHNYQDIHRTKELVMEMSVNGILGDLATVGLLDRISESMRSMNDGDFDLTVNQKEGESPLTVGVVWCRENAEDLNYIEGYLRKLKVSQM